MVKVWIKHLARTILPVYLFKSGSLSVAYAGHSTIKRYYFGRFPLRTNQVAPLFMGRKWYRALPDLLGRKCDLLFAEAGAVTVNYFRTRQGWLIPEWTPMHIDITRPLHEIRKHGVSDFASVEKHIRKFDLTYEISESRAGFERFYETMYLPYLKNRHGEEAMIETFSELLKGRPNLQLLTVCEQGEPVSGALIERRSGFIHLFRVGIVGGDTSLISHGAIGCLYYFAIVEGQKSGCTYIDVGGTRPFVTDGITQSKLRHSAVFAADYSSQKEHLWLACNPASDAARQFLESNPFIYWDNAFRLKRSDAGNPASGNSANPS